MAAIVGALAIVTVGEYVFGVGVGLDSVLGARMASATAVTLGLISVAFVMGASAAWAQVLLAVAALPPYIALVGYAINVNGLYSFGPFGSVSLQTAASTALLCVGGLAANPAGWLQRIDAGTDVGSVLVRWLVPPGLALFPVLGLVGQTGTGLGWWTPPFAVAFSAVGGSLFTVGLIVWAAGRLTRLDRRRMQASELAEQDALTGAWNRRHLDRVLTRSFHGTPREQGVALLALDLDDFKSINDRFGHDEGDRTLQDFAACVRAHTRPDDVFVRTGGDEFVIVLRHTSEGDARSAAETLLSALETWKAKRHSRPAVSVGIAVMNADVQSPADLEKRADLALYDAKRNGKHGLAVYHGRAIPA
ncbi:MAG: GGDEF domain-containing protein [Acidimicrobiales bacterium]